MSAKSIIVRSGMTMQQVVEDQIVEVVTQAEEDYGALIPEHAILRFARFLLPKIQADLDKKEE